MQDNYFRVQSLYAFESRFQVIERVVCADRDEDASRSDSHAGGGQLSFRRWIKLIELDVSRARLPLVHSMFGDLKDGEQNKSECDSRHRGIGFCEQVNNRNEIG